MAAIPDALIGRCLAGQSDGWNQLFDSVRPAMYGMATRLCNNCDDAEDVVQEAILKVYRGLGTFQRGRNLDAWLQRIVHYAFIDLCVRPSYRHDLHSDAFVQDGEPIISMESADPSEGPEQIVLSSDYMRRIGQAILGLPPRYGQSFRLFVIEQRTAREIEANYGIYALTVRSRVSRARKLLRERIGEP